MKTPALIAWLAMFCLTPFGLCAQPSDYPAAKASAEALLR